MRKIQTKSPLFKPSNLIVILAAPLAMMITSCSTPTGPITHQHGNLIHSHEMGQTNTHGHNVEKSSTPKVATSPRTIKKTVPTPKVTKKPVAKVTKAAPKVTTKPLAKTTTVKKVATQATTKPTITLPKPPVGLFHKHHGHIDPTTGTEGVPC